METQLDHTYLRPGIISRAAAVGVAAIGIGAGVLLACWGLSFFWHVDDAVLRSLDALAKQTAGLSDTFRELETTLGQRTAVGFDALGAKVDSLSHRLDVIDQHITARSLGASGQPQSTPTGQVIKREVTVFNSITHGAGDVTTGWTYKDGASDGQPINQYCYYTTVNNHAGFRIDLAFNGQRLFNENMAKVPQLEEAIAKCQWWTS
jgi:hypothetical protein